MWWMILGSNTLWCAATVILSAYIVSLLRRRTTLEQQHAEVLRSNIRLTQHLDFLIRRFHLRTPPYVAESSTIKTSGMGIGEPVSMRCWHCQRTQQEPHDASCPWFYVQNNIEYVEHRPSLRQNA